MIRRILALAVAGATLTTPAIAQPYLTGAQARRAIINYESNPPDQMIVVTSIKRCKHASPTRVACRLGAYFADDLTFDLGGFHIRANATEWTTYDEVRLTARGTVVRPLPHRPNYFN